MGAWGSGRLGQQAAGPRRGGGVRWERSQFSGEKRSETSTRNSCRTSAGTWVRLRTPGSRRRHAAAASLAAFCRADGPRYSTSSPHGGCTALATPVCKRRLASPRGCRQRTCIVVVLPQPGSPATWQYGVCHVVSRPSSDQNCSACSTLPRVQLWLPPPAACDCTGCMHVTGFGPTHDWDGKGGAPQVQHLDGAAVGGAAGHGLLNSTPVVDLHTAHHDRGVVNCLDLRHADAAVPCQLEIAKRTVRLPCGSRE